MLINREAARNNIHIIFTLREILCDGGKIDAFHAVHIVKVTGNHAARNIAVLRPVKQSNLGACGHFINTVKRVIINEIMIKHIEKARTQNLFL